MWVHVAACLLTFALATESEVEPCERPAMLRAVKDMAPLCIEACPAICPKLNGLIMTALMGIDPTSQVCGAFDVWVCMDQPACTPLLSAAQSYDLFPVLQNEAELRETCNMPPAPTTEPQASVAAVPEVVGVVANSTETTQQPSSSSTSETSVRSTSSTSSQNSDNGQALRGTSSTTEMGNASAFSNDAVLYDFAHRHASLDWLILFLVCALGRL